MDIISLPTDWTGYINKKPEIVLSNCKLILTKLAEMYPIALQLVGMGNSGAYLVSALSMVNQMSVNRLEINTIVFGKNYNGTSASNDFSQSPIVFIDDDIQMGRTVNAVADRLKIVSRHDLISLVEVAVVMSGSYQPFEHPRILQDCFPNLKLWIR